MDAMLRATARNEEDHFWFRGLRRQARLLLDAALEGRKIEHIVDCGAGTGRNADWLREYGHVVAVERSQTGLDAARARGRSMVRGSVTALPLRDASMDLATSFDVLYCLDDDSEAQALREMHRVLKPGGLVIGNVAALDMLKGSHSTLTMEVRRYTRASLSEKLTRAGFRIRRVTFTNFTPFPFALGVRGLERLRGRADEASDADLQTPAAPVNAVFDLSLRAEAAWLKIANLPIGTSVMAVAEK